MSEPPPPQQVLDLSPHCVSHPVQVGVRIFRHVIVEDDIDPLNVHSSAKEVSRHQDPPLEVLELLIARQSRGRGQSQREDYQTQLLQALRISISPALKGIMRGVEG